MSAVRGARANAKRGGLGSHDAASIHALLEKVKMNKPSGGYTSGSSLFPDNIQQDTTAPPAPPLISTMTPAGDAPIIKEPAVKATQADKAESQSASASDNHVQQPAAVDSQNDDQAQHGADEELAPQPSLAGSHMESADGQSNRSNRPRREHRDQNEPREQRAGPGARPRYIPQNRDVAEIRKEDEQSAELYKDLFDHDEDIIVTGLNAPIVFDNWSEAPICASVMKNIELANYIKPRKIQSYAIPVILDGQDIKGQAETGSGKSAAFLIPIISTIAKAHVETPNARKVRNRPLCIIVEPTRELALQLYDQSRKLADNTNVRVVKAYGEYDYKANVAEIVTGADIIVGTPGRIVNFMYDGIFSTEELRWLVLDEADRLLDDNFQRDINKIITIKNFPPKEQRQTLLFSATFPENVQQLVADVLKDNHVSVTNKRPSAPNAKVEQSFEQVDSFSKKERVVNVLKDEYEKLKAENPDAKQQRTLVFVEKKRDADVVALYLCQYELPATTINADRTQDLREMALKEFRDGTKPILVATDVCARGLDIKDLDIVINMDMPRDIATYIHRIGRTGRIERGRAISFYDPEGDQDKKNVKELVEMLETTGSAVVPDWLKEAADSIEVAPNLLGGDDLELGNLDDFEIEM